MAIARRLDHTYSETIALAYASLLHQMRHDSARVLESAEAVVSRCERYGFAYYGDWARVLIGWVRGQDNPSEAIGIIEGALERLDTQRAQARRPYYLSLLAEVCHRAGRRERAEAIVDDAINMARARSDVWWLPALYLQKGEWRLGLDLARAQRSRALEARILASVSQNASANVSRTL